MRKFNLQPEKFIPCMLGYIIIPAYFILPLVLMRDPDLNLTGLLDSAWYRLSAIAVLAYFACMMYTCMMDVLPRKQVVTELTALCVLCIATLFVPYTEGESFLSSLHILLAYAGFGMICLCTLQSFRYTPQYRNLFLAVCVFAFAHSLMHMEVTGVSEAAIACILSVLFTSQITKEKHPA